MHPARCQAIRPQCLQDISVPFHETTSSIAKLYCPYMACWSFADYPGICQVSRTDHQYPFACINLHRPRTQHDDPGQHSNQDHLIKSSKAASPQEETTCWLTYCSNVHDLFHDIRTEWCSVRWNLSIVLLLFLEMSIQIAVKEKLVFNLGTSIYKCNLMCSLVSNEHNDKSFSLQI